VIRKRDGLIRPEVRQDKKNNNGYDRNDERDKEPKPEASAIILCNNTSDQLESKQQSNSHWSEEQFKETKDHLTKLFS